jgi:hypothetical protein
MLEKLQLEENLGTLSHSLADLPVAPMPDRGLNDIRGYPLAGFAYLI